MIVESLDHINIHTDDVPGTAAFYADLLGLEARPTPGGFSPEKARWLYDGGGRAIIHLFAGPVTPGPTGPIHHVALRCAGKAEMIARLEQRGAKYDVHEASAELTQIFTRDPHGILLELNFADEGRS
jgi:catechol 2,3-dioxygenase-like lactoylglutathione lyase family enzyme